LEPEAPEWKRRPRLTSTGWMTLTLVLLALLGATVALVLLVRDSGEPHPQEAANASAILQMREVLDVIPSGSPEWNSVTVTCFARGTASASRCLHPLAAAERSVVLLAADGSERFALGPSLISTADVARASAEPLGGMEGWQIEIELTPSASERFSDITTRLVGKQLAIVVDDQVVSAPTVAEPITSGHALIAGVFTEREARDLAARLAPHS
jgi:preprotein translocase subunit SecD